MISRMQSSSRGLLSLVVALLAAAGPGLAQTADRDSHFSIDIAGGFLVPVGTSAKVSESGVNLVIGFGHRFGQRFLVTSQFELAAFNDARSTGTLSTQATTEINLFRSSVGLEFLLSSPASPWQFSTRVSTGIGHVKSGGLPPRDLGFETRRVLIRLNADVFTLAGGFQVGRTLGSVTPFVRAETVFYFMGTNIGPLRGLDDSISRSESLIGFPIQVGLRFRL